MQFHAIQHDVVPNDWKSTRVTIEKQIVDANPRANDFLVLCEMSDTGWSMQLDSITGIGTLDWACGIAKRLGVWIQVGWADLVGSRGHNCVSICSPAGEPIATYTKIFTCNPLGENDYYDGGEELVVVDLGEVKICPLICYDVRFPELWRPAAISGVDVFTVSSSWPKQRISHWHSLLIARALENQAFVVAANRVGEDAIATWGGNSLICTPLGELLAQGTNTEIETCSATIDSQLARSWRKEFPVFEDIQEELIGKIQVREITA